MQPRPVPLRATQPRMVLQPAMLPKRVPRLTRLQTRVVLQRVLRPSPLLPVTLLPSLLRLPNRMLLRRLQMALRMRLIRLPQPPPDRSMLQVTRMWHDDDDEDRDDETT